MRIVAATVDHKIDLFSPQFCSFASLAGAPAAGAIVKSSGYLGASLESGILIVFGMFVVFCGRTLVAREKGNWRV